MKLLFCLLQVLITNVMVTFYNPEPSQCSGNPLITADGSRINLQKLKNREIRWVAVSRDLLKKHPFGSKIYIEIKDRPDLTGVYEVHDTTAPRHRNLIDILCTRDFKMGSYRGTIRHHVKPPKEPELMIPSSKVDSSPKIPDVPQSPKEMMPYVSLR